VRSNATAKSRSATPPLFLYANPKLPCSLTYPSALSPIWLLKSTPPGRVSHVEVYFAILLPTPPKKPLLMSSVNPIYGSYTQITLKTSASITNLRHDTVTLTPHFYDSISQLLFN